MKTIIDRNADILQEDLKSEMNEQIMEVLKKVCPLDEIDQFKEWIEEETNWMIYYSDVWIDTKTRVLISTETLYKKFMNRTE